MIEKMIVYGGGGHAKTVIDLIRAIGRYEIVGIIDDEMALGTEVMGVPVIGASSDLVRLRGEGVRCAVNAVGGIGNPSVRWAVFERLIEADFDQPALVHPLAVIEPSAVIDDAVQVLAGTYISSDSRVGFGTLLNAGVILSHDDRLGRCVNLSPGAALGGAVRIGDFTQVGMRATINLGVTVGRSVRIGNGATVKDDVPDGTRIFAGAVWPDRAGRDARWKTYRKIA